MESTVIPHLVADRILRYINKRCDMLNILTVSKEWSRAFATAIYQAPCLNTLITFESLSSLIHTQVPYHPYAFLIQKLDIVGGAADNIYMGDLDTCLQKCTNIKVLRLERCFHISNILIQSIANNCKNLEQLDLPGCPLTDKYVKDLARNCVKLQHIDFSFTNMTIASAYHIISNAPKIKGLDIQECNASQIDLDLLTRGPVCMIEHLNFRNSQVSDDFLRFVAGRCPDLKSLILESCKNITDASIMKVANSCLGLTTLDLSFCHQITDLSVQVFTIRASSSHGGNLQEAHFSACDEISASAIHQLVQKSTRLELLVLDGCEKMNNTCIKRLATYNQGDVNCSYEATDLAILAALPIERARYHSELPATPPISPKSSRDDLKSQLIEKVSRITRAKSRSLLSRRSMVNLKASDVGEFTNAVYEERANKIRERRISKTIDECPSKEIDPVIKQGRSLSMQKSMSFMSMNKNIINSPPAHGIPPKPSFLSFIPEKLKTLSRPKSMLNVFCKPFIHNPSFFAESIPELPEIIEEDTSLQLSATQRNRYMSTSSTNSRQTSSSECPSNQATTLWSADPEFSDIKTKIILPTSQTWSSRLVAPKVTFLDPWDTPSKIPATTKGINISQPRKLRNRQSVTNMKKDFSAPTDLKVEKTAEVIQPIKSPKLFVYSVTKRGKLLLRLKIETRIHGLQELTVHEYDDPTKLAEEFCSYWLFKEYKAALVKLITIRKNKLSRRKYYFN